MGDYTNVLQQLLQGNGAMPNPDIPNLLQMAMLGNGPGGGPPPGQDTSAPAPSVGNVDPQRQALMQQAFAPQPVQQAPVPAQPSTLQKIFAGLSDAANAYAMHRYTGSGLAALAQQAGQRQAAQAYNAHAEAASQAESKARQAAYQLQGLDKKEAATQAQKDKEDIQKNLLQEREDAYKQRSADREAALAQAKELKKMELEAQDRRERSSQDHADAIARLHERLRNDDKTATVQLKNLGDAKGVVNNIANMLPQLLSGYTENTKEGQVPHPAMTPEQIVNRYRRSVARLNLDPDAQKAADTYFQQEVGFLVPKIGAPSSGPAPAAGGGPGPAGRIGADLFYKYPDLKQFMDDHPGVSITMPPGWNGEGASGVR